MAGQDRWWAPHSGRLPGSQTPLPYRAPIDHVLDLERTFARKLDEEAFGFNVPFKEYSFMQNPRMPARVRDDSVTIQMCAPGDTDCADGSREASVSASDRTVRLRRNLTDVQIGTALGPLAKRFKVLHFRNITGAFWQHEDAKDRERFARRLQQLPSIWCCTLPPPNKPGHVWYDVQWDIVPHTDLHNRKWRTAWHIVLGP